MEFDVIWKVFESSITWYIVGMLLGMTEWQTKMKRDVGRPQLDLTVQDSKQNNRTFKWKRECPDHSGCHLATCWSWASYHTSSEKGHPGLPTDIKIRNIVQLIGILWSYLEHFWGPANSPLYFACHSATSWHILGYYISGERGHP